MGGNGRTPRKPTHTVLVYYKAHMASVWIELILYENIQISDGTSIKIETSFLDKYLPNDEYYVPEF